MTLAWWILLIALGLAARLSLRAYADAKAATAELLDSVVKNSLHQFGYKPDGASLGFLARHPFLAARAWHMIEDGGAVSLTRHRPVRDENEAACGKLARYIRDRGFGATYPCARAVLQYAVYLCDATDTHQCRHPKDELTEQAAQRDRSRPPEETAIVTAVAGVDVPDDPEARRSVPPANLPPISPEERALFNDYLESRNLPPLPEDNPSPKPARPKLHGDK